MCFKPLSPAGDGTSIEAYQMPESDFGLCGEPFEGLVVGADNVVVVPDSLGFLFAFLEVPDEAACEGFLDCALDVAVLDLHSEALEAADCFHAGHGAKRVKAGVAAFLAEWPDPRDFFEA